MSGISGNRDYGGAIVREAEGLDRELSNNRLLWHKALGLKTFSLITLVKQHG